jgi:hypothetical protein
MLYLHHYKNILKRNISLSLTYLTLCSSMEHELLKINNLGFFRHEPLTTIT